MYVVYIIYGNRLDRFYIGYTTNLEKRILEHNTGISTYTSKASDWILKFSQSFDMRQEAIGKEKEMKGKKSRRYLEWVIINQ